MPDDPEVIRTAIQKAYELGADIAGAIEAAQLIGCPSATAKGEVGSKEDRGTGYSKRSAKISFGGYTTSMGSGPVSYPTRSVTVGYTSKMRRPLWRGTGGWG